MPLTQARTHHTSDGAGDTRELVGNLQDALRAHEVQAGDGGPANFWCVFEE